MAVTMKSSESALEDQLFPLIKGPGNLSHGGVKLVLFFGWLGASPRAAQRYIDLYHELNYDVLYIHGHVTQFVWPPNSMKLARKLLTRVGELTEYEDLLCHAMSIGAYNYTSCLMLLQDPPGGCRSFRDRLRGVVFDSLTLGSIERMKNGVKHGLSQSPLMQFIIPRLLTVYFFFTYTHTLKFFENGVRLFEDNPLLVPTLILYSRDDPMCDADKIDDIIKKWREDLKMPVSFVCWAQSKHALHIKTHPADYTKAVRDFVNVYCLSRQPRSEGGKSKL